MTISIITADDRMTERRGAKVVLLGPPGVGKTYSVRTLDVAHVLYVNIEDGDQALLGVPVPMVHIRTWKELRDLACQIVGPDESFAPGQCYSPAHYDAIGGKLEDLNQFETVVFDSVTAASRLCLRYAEQQPEAVARNGAKDTRGMYGVLAREMCCWANHLQHARTKNIVFTGVLERHVDELNHAEWRLQCEGAKFARELPAIVDQVITYQFLNFGDGNPPSRGFVCTSPNAWSLPAKDRSGRLDQVEPPNLGRLLKKLTNRERN